MAMMMDSISSTVGEDESVPFLMFLIRMGGDNVEKLAEW